MVNQLIASREMRILRKSLEELDEKTIASALDSEYRPPTQQRVARQTASEAVKAFNANRFNLQTAKGLINVKPERQQEILQLIEKCNEYSTVFARGLVLKTPVVKRVKSTSSRTTWTKAGE